MTINKIATSVVAAALISTSAYAITIGSGTLAVDGGVKLSVGSELIAREAVEANVTTMLTYTTDIEASSATEPAFELSFAGLNTASNLHIINDANTTVIATFDRVDGSTVIFSTANGVTVERNGVYRVTSIDNNGSIGADELSINLPVGTTDFDATLTLWNNNGDAKLDTATATLFEKKTQFATSVTTPLSASIDASNELKSFSTASGGATTTSTDTLVVQFTNDTTINYKATLVSAEFNITAADGNLSAYVLTAPSSSITTADGNATVAITASNIDVDFTEDANTSYNPNIVLDTTEATAMTETTFAAKSTVVFNRTGTNYTINPTDSAVAGGEWDIYGYNGQIPNVVSNATKETYVNITNTSSRSATPVFTILAQTTHSDGTTTGSGIVCENVTAASIASNSSVKYSMTNILALSGAENCQDDAITNYALELTVPTEPNFVYVNSQQRKGDTVTVLPVYNTSEYSY